MTVKQIIWTAEQVCGECGTGVFADHHGQAICIECGHEHPMDRWNLDSDEAFAWMHSTQDTAWKHGPTLHVVAYA